MTGKNYSERAPRLLTVATIDRFVRHVYPHLDACRAAGFRVDIACTVSDFRDEILTHCDKLYEIPFSRSPVHPSNLAALARLIPIIKSENYDIVHSHTPAGGMIGRAAATIAGTSIRIYTAHGFHFHPEGRPITNFIFKALEGFAGNNLSDWVEVINSEDYANALLFGIVPKNKLVKIDGAGIRTTYFNRCNFSAADRALVRKEADIPADAPIVGAIAELLPRKRLHDTINSIAKLKVSFPDVVLMILGSGELRAELEALTVAKKVSANVRFLGFRRDVPRFIAAMDVFAFSSEQEGLPVALMEAMCMRVPAVATDIRGNRDIIVDGENGFLVPVGDSDAMAAAIRRILSDGDLAKKFAQRGHELVVNTYSVERTAAQQMVVYSKAITLGRASGRVRNNISTIEEWNLD